MSENLSVFGFDPRSIDITTGVSEPLCALPQGFTLRLTDTYGIQCWQELIQCLRSLLSLGLRSAAKAAASGQSGAAISALCRALRST